MFPHSRLERRLQKKGYKTVLGVDEAGRGTLAGPVVAAAVFIQNPKLKIFQKIRDSKKLTSGHRENLYKNLTKTSDLKWGIGKTSESQIDKINILKATKLAMKRAVKNLERKLRKTTTHPPPSRKCGPLIDFLILDGNFSLDLKILQRSIKKADEKVLSCACASILAKVTRDRIMRKLDKKYSNKYKFSRHKGYGTKLHLKMLKRFGPCKIHRKSFGPVSKMQKFKR